MRRFLYIFLALLMLWMAMGGPALAAEKEDGYIDHYTKGYFRKSHAVYSGPGEQYFRAAGGKALYGSGAARYYGTGPEGWMLIGYSINSVTYRLGYIKASFDDMVTNKGEDRTLSLKSLAAVALQPLDFFDDPGIGNAPGQPLCQLPKDAQVTYLGQFSEDWTYIEIDASYLGSPARGFVSSGNLVTFAAGPGQGGESASDSSVLVEGKAELKWETTSMAWSRKMEVTSNAGWKAISDAPWIYLSADGNSLQIQLAENQDPEARMGTIRLTSGEATAQITVMQSGAQ